MTRSADIVNYAPSELCACDDVHDAAAASWAFLCASLNKV